MARPNRLVAAILIIIGLAGCATSPALKEGAVRETTRARVVYIEADYGDLMVLRGGGVAISPHEILTAGHLLVTVPKKQIAPRASIEFPEIEAKRITITRYDGQKMSGKLVWYSRECDCALIHVADTLPHYFSMRADPPVVGEPILVVGHPRGFNAWTVSAGAVVRLDISLPRLPPARLVETDAYGDKGMSGGAVVDAHERLIGIVIGIHLKNYTLYFRSISIFCEIYNSCDKFDFQ